MGGRTLKFYYPPAVARKISVDELRWWGRINENTHHLYLNYPCPAVYYSRIVHDYLGVFGHVDAEDDDDEAPEPDENWDLPARIRHFTGITLNPM